MPNAKFSNILLNSAASAALQNYAACIGKKNKILHAMKNHTNITTVTIINNWLLVLTDNIYNIPSYQRLASSQPYLTCTFMDKQRSQFYELISCQQMWFISQLNSVFWHTVMTCTVRTVLMTTIKNKCQTEEKPTQN